MSREKFYPPPRPSDERDKKYDGSTMEGKEKFDRENEATRFTMNPDIKRVYICVHTCACTSSR